MANTLLPVAEICMMTSVHYVTRSAYMLHKASYLSMSTFEDATGVLETLMENILVYTCRHILGEIFTGHQCF